MVDLDALRRAGAAARRSKAKNVNAQLRAFMPKDNPLEDLPAPLLCKLGSILVHVDESTGPDGHTFDVVALKSLMADPEVTAWVAEMDRLALVPKKRSAR